MGVKKVYHKNKHVASVKVHATFFPKLRGLMFSPPLKKNQGIILSSTKENLTAIHMFFVFFPIDAIWLDKNKKVIYIARNIKPFTPCIASQKPAQYIVELPKNIANHIKINDILTLK